MGVKAAGMTLQRGVGWARTTRRTRSVRAWPLDAECAGSDRAAADWPRPACRVPAEKLVQDAAHGTATPRVALRSAQ
ncbi:hypothetical protein SB85_17165 [Xanthomonas sacchari]|nr:hypothetical protein SB85_17165 [Xanthomonas sacchari]